MNTQQIINDAFQVEGAITLRALITTLEYQGHRVDHEQDIYPDRLVLRVDQGDEISLPITPGTHGRYTKCGDLVIFVDD